MEERSRIVEWECEQRRLTREYPISPKLVYLASCYSSARGNHGVDLYVDEAKVWARKLHKAGVAVYCPVLSTHNFDGIDIPAWVWQLADFAILDRCDALAMHPNANDSRGAEVERQRAVAQCKPVFYLDDERAWGKLCAWAKQGTVPMKKAVEGAVEGYYPNVQALRDAGYNVVVEEERRAAGA